MSKYQNVVWPVRKSTDIHIRRNITGQHSFGTQPTLSFARMVKASCQKTKS